MSVMTPAQWTNTTALIEFEEVMRDEADRKLWSYDQVYGDMKKTSEFEAKGYLWTAFGLPSTRKFGENIRTEKMKEIGQWQISDVELALGTDIDEKLLEDMRHITEKEFLNNMGEGFGESFAQAESIYAAMPFNRAFSAVLQPMWDLAALCDDHPLDDGTTYANYIASGSVSFSRIWDMMDAMKLDQRQYKGLKSRGTPVKFLCHDVKERDVSRIFTQEYEYDGTIATGGTTTHVSSKNVNNLRGKNIKVIYCQELDDEDAMFLLGRRAMKNFKFRSRKALTTEWSIEGGRRNRTRSCFVHRRIMVGVTHHIDVIGAQGIQ